MKSPTQNIERSARGMMRTFGANAGIEASVIAARWAKRKDAEGLATWLAILETIDALSKSSETHSLSESPAAKTDWDKERCQQVAGKLRL